MTLKQLLPLFALVFAFSCKEEKKADDADQKHAPVQLPVMTTTDADVNAYAPVDVSPMDMSYFPIDYPKIKMANGTTTAPLARVVYSRPHLAKRRLFEGILRYEEPWRLGANESTEIEFFKPVTIQGKRVPAGRYIIYCIPHPDKWTIVLNRNIDTWGLKQDSNQDVERFDVPATTNNPRLEYFTMVFEKTSTGADLLIAWDDVVVKLPIQF